MQPSQRPSRHDQYAFATFAISHSSRSACGAQSVRMARCRCVDYVDCVIGTEMHYTSGRYSLSPIATMAGLRKQPFVVRIKKLSQHLLSRILQLRRCDQRSIRVAASLSLGLGLGVPIVLVAARRPRCFCLVSCVRASVVSTNGNRLAEVVWRQPCTPRRAWSSETLAWLLAAGREFIFLQTALMKKSGLQENDFTAQASGCRASNSSRSGVRYVWRY